MRKALVFALVLGILAIGLPFTANTAYADYHDRPWCYFLFQDCEDDEDEYTAPAPSEPVATITNHAPVWTAGQTSFTIKQGQFLQFTVSAYDSDNDSLAYDASFLPIGSSFNSQTGAFSWTPDEYQWGNYSIRFSAYDGKARIYQTIAIAVERNGSSSDFSDNNKPSWSHIGDQSVFVGHVLQFSVWATDLENDTLSYEALNLPNGATFEGSSRTFSWTPIDTQIGTHVVTFRVSDGRATSDIGVIIRVGKPNNKPSFVNFAPPGAGKVGQLYHYDVSAVDFDNDPLAYSLPSAPSGMTVHDTTGVILWTPSPTQTGFNYVQAAVSDGKSQTVQGFYIFVDAAGVSTSPTPLPPSNPRPAPPQVPNEAKIVFSDIKFENVDGEVFVSWTTNIPSGSRVIYDTLSQADKTRDFTYKNATADDRDLIASHRVKIGKLETDTVYYLRLVSKTDRQTAVSNEIAFILLKSGKIGAIFGASLIDIFGALLGSSAFLWLIIAALVALLFVAYRKLQKNSSPL